MPETIPRIKNSLDRLGARLSEERLIRFDYRSILLVAALLVLFSVAVAGKLHGSSVAFWNNVIPAAQPADSGLLLGEPKAIRSDEWLVGTPAMLSQYELGFPTENDNLGGASDPLIANMPVEHFSTAFRPQHWGWFFLDAERGFAFFWSLKGLSLVTGSFLLLMLVTNSRFWLSLGGAAWLYFSSFIQWWYSTTLVEMVASFCLIFVALAWLALSRRRAAVAVAALLLVATSVNFVLFFYPPFQLPLAWLLVFLLAGFLLQNDQRQLLKQNLRTRLPLVAGCLLAAGAAVFLFYLDARETMKAITETVFPGQRVVSAGDINVERLFSGFTGAPLGENRFPPIWTNASEAANFILLFPVVLAAAAWRAVRRRANGIMTSLLLAYLLLLSLWPLVKLPKVVGRLTLLSFVPANRALLGLGVGSIILTVLYLSRADGVSSRFAAVSAAVAFPVLLLYGRLLNQLDPVFFRPRNVILIAVFFSAVTWLLLSRRRLLFFLAILVALLPAFTVNPLTAGLASLRENRVSLAVRGLQQQDPDAKWVVYGSYTLAELLKASGAQVLNGTKYTPDWEIYAMLDPGGGNVDIYNRYARISFTEPRAGSAMTVDFTLTTLESFTVTADPCGPELKELGITRFAFFYEPDEYRLSCLAPLASLPESGVYLYQRK